MEPKKEKSVRVTRTGKLTKRCNSLIMAHSAGFFNGNSASPDGGGAA